MHTSQQYKQQLTKIASLLDTKEVGTTQPADNAQVTATTLQAHFDQTMVEEKPFKILKIQVSSIPASTVDLTNSYVEEGGTSLVPVTEEVDDGNNFQAFMNLFGGSNIKSSSVPESTQLEGLMLFPHHYFFHRFNPYLCFLLDQLFHLHHPSSIMFRHVYPLLLNLSMYNHPRHHPLHLKFLKFHCTSLPLHHHHPLFLRKF